MTQKLLEGYGDNDDDRKSDATNETGKASRMAKTDMFADRDIETYSSNPVRGRKYLAFTILMVILLSIKVWYNAKNTTLEELA